MTAWSREAQATIRWEYVDLWICCPKKYNVEKALFGTKVLLEFARLFWVHYWVSNFDITLILIDSSKRWTLQTSPGSTRFLHVPWGPQLMSSSPFFAWAESSCSITVLTDLLWIHGLSPLPKHSNSSLSQGVHSASNPRWRPWWKQQVD